MRIKYYYADPQNHEKLQAIRGARWFFYKPRWTGYGNSGTFDSWPNREHFRQVPDLYLTLVNQEVLPK
jgi:hypothetical protein